MITAPMAPACSANEARIKGVGRQRREGSTSMGEILPRADAHREPTGIFRLWFDGLRLWREPCNEKSVPEPAPGEPVVTARHHIDVVPAQRGGHQSVAASESILATKPEVHGQGPGAQGTNEAPDAPLIVILGKLSGLPALETLGTLDLGSDEVTAEIGCKEAQPRELTLVPFGVPQCEIAPERDPAQPHGAAESGCRQKDLIPQPGEDAPV